MKKLVGIIGTHGTGKTTLSFQLASHYKHLGHNVKIIQEVARTCPFPLNELMTRETALWIYFEHSRKELEALRDHDIVISDRTAFDSFIYACVLNLPNLVEYKSVAKHYLKSAYEILFFVRPDMPIEEDGIRCMDIEFQKKIDKMFEYHLKDMPIVELKSSQVFSKEKSWTAFC